MSLRLSSSLLALTFAAGTAQAEVPQVVTDIAAVQSLAAQVMGDLGEPVALMRQGASPHDYALRPSDAKALQEADLVLWTGPDLAPWLDEMIDTVAKGVPSVALAEVEGTVELPFREGANFEAHSHDHADEDMHGDEAHDHDDEHAHDEHSHEDHEDQDGHDDHDHHSDDDAHGDEHDHHGMDPHSWLDPENGRVWLGVIAEKLAGIDPEHAETYRANAEAAQADLDAVIAEVRSELAPVQDMRFIVFHDAYQYFENRFGLSAAGAISLSDASDPSPARIREIQEVIVEQNVSCVFSEPQFSPALVKTVLNGTNAHSGVIDPLGVEIAPGAEFYAALIREVATAFVDCAGNK